MSNEISTQTAAPRSSTSLLMDPHRFEHVQRIAKVYAMSPLFPEHLRKGSQETAVANAILVLNIADRLNEDALTVAQSIYFVSGKPGWSTSYCIAKANQHGVFKNPIDWEVKGSGDSLSVTAFAEMAGTGKRVQITCDMKMAKAEGWTKNSKYNSMPEQMLRYRSATFLIRLYCPEILVGVPAQVEVELGMKDVTPDDHADVFKATQTKPEPEDVEMVEGDAVEEDKAAADQKAKEEDNAAREALQRKRDEEAKAKAQQKAKEQEENPAEQEKQEANTPDPEQFRGLLEMIKGDLMDAGRVDDVTDLYAAQIDQMKVSAPAIYDELQAEFETFRAKEADKSNG